MARTPSVTLPIESPQRPHGQETKARSKVELLLPQLGSLHPCIPRFRQEPHPQDGKQEAAKCWQSRRAEILIVPGSLCDFLGSLLNDHPGKRDRAREREREKQKQQRHTHTHTRAKSEETSERLRGSRGVEPESVRRTDDLSRKHHSGLGVNGACRPGFCRVVVTRPDQLDLKGPLIDSHSSYGSTRPYRPK